MDGKGTEVNFLDVRVKIEKDAENYSLMTDIYYKITDSKQYLDFRSNHPRHIKSNIPINLARRLCLIVNKEDILNLRLKELKKIPPFEKLPREFNNIWHNKSEEY